MAPTSDVLKLNLIEELAAGIEQRLGKDGPSGSAFLRQYFGQISYDDLRRADKRDLVASAAALWEFARTRQPGKAKIRLYNPTLKKDGWTCRHSVLELINDDMPFLVDSVTNVLNQRELDIHLVIHPVLQVERKDSPRILDPELEATGPDRGPESWMHFEIDQIVERKELSKLEKRLAEVLEDVRSTVQDWRRMRDKMTEVYGELGSLNAPLPGREVADTRAFLKWVNNDFFVYLGYREYDLVDEGGRKYVRARPESGLGILRRMLPSALRRQEAPLGGAGLDYAHEKNLLLVTKAKSKSTVHRSVHMDYIGIKRFGPDGQVVGERRFLGLFTSSAYNQSVRRIPLLKSKIARMLKRSHLSTRSHDGKSLIHILESFPRDELFSISDDDLFRTSQGILQLQERHRLALFVRRDTFENFISCQVYLPREKYDTQLRKRVESILAAAFDGEIEASRSHLGDSPLARWHIIVKVKPGRIPDVDLRQVEALLAEAARSWDDRFKDALLGEHDERRALSLHRRYSNAFSAAYVETFGPQDALRDLDYVERMLKTGDFQLNLYRASEGPENRVRFKIYHKGDIPLSHIVPILENMGLSVLNGVPYRVRPGGAEGYGIRDFDMEPAHGRAIDLALVRDNFHETFAGVWRNEAENDGLNQLVVDVGLSCREVVVLRAYMKYLLQVGVAFSQDYMTRILIGNRHYTKLLIRLFQTRFDPDIEKVKIRSVGLQKEMREALHAARSLDEDRIIRCFKNLINATLRTNFFQVDTQGRPKPCLSFKFDSARVEGLPAPRPKFEVFTYSPRFEAVHLRGGEVARGGIRWSDRREDFRSEILGLIKAQMVKNAVIVPVGAKGGFVVKSDLDSRALKKEAVACYKMMIRSLLDLTDNRVDDEVVPPPRVVRMDGDDPYLVVAADKGTATFSDIANEISKEYGFWLGDAFASGGSAGYDHKKMGITARGAFVAVERHFRELGVNIHEEDGTVVGVGDMSGDVFGNGMLYTPHIKLQGAFNHLHIFVDPAPDPAVSFRERKRLFDLDGSSWADYDRQLISEGGGVFDRQARSIPVSPQMKELFGLRERAVTPVDLIQALLRAPVDLIWFGGIGTYVKSRDERHFDADDKVNDSLRIDAGQLRCKAICEGANLAVTQRGRVEFALNGGRINTDAIDNSAGVDASDHEVNIKLLLGDAIAAGKMTPEQRNRLLVKMTDEIGRLVLRDNYLQTQAISLAESRALTLADRLRLTIVGLEESGRLDRELEFLPTDAVLKRREALNQGLVRPEIAVLLAYAKIDLFHELLHSDLPDDPMLEEDLVLYFPTPLRKRFAAAIGRHRLRREIIATFATNSMINRVGPSFVASMKKATGMPASAIARAYLITREILGLPNIWSEIEALDYRIPASFQARLFSNIGSLVEHATRWLLFRRPQPLDIADNVRYFDEGIGILAQSIKELLPPYHLKRFEERRRNYEKEGIPEGLAQRLAQVGVMESSLDIVQIARGRDVEVAEVARIYFRLGARFKLDWLRQSSSLPPTASMWDKKAATAAFEGFFDQQAGLTNSVLSSRRRSVRAWLKSRQSLVRRIDDLLRQVRSAKKVDLAMLTVVNSQLRLLRSS